MIRIRVLKRIMAIIIAALIIFSVVIFVERFFWIFTDKRPIYDFFVSWPIVQTFRHSSAWVQLIVILVVAGIGVFCEDEVRKWIKGKGK